MILMVILKIERYENRFDLTSLDFRVLTKQIRVYSAIIKKVVRFFQLFLLL